VRIRSLAHRFALCGGGCGCDFRTEAKRDVGLKHRGRRTRSCPLRDGYRERNQKCSVNSSRSRFPIRDGTSVEHDFEVDVLEGRKNNFGMFRSGSKSLSAGNVPFVEALVMGVIRCGDIRLPNDSRLQGMSATLVYRIEAPAELMFLGSSWATLKSKHIVDLRHKHHPARAEVTAD